MRGHFVALRKLLTGSVHAPKLLLVFAAFMTLSQNSVGFAQSSAVAAPEQQAIQLEPIVGFITAAAQGNTSEVERFLTSGVAVGEADPFKKITALHSAAANGHTRIVARLLDIGADPLRADAFGATPLVNAAYGGHVATTKTILEKLGSAALTQLTVQPGAMSPLNAAVVSGNKMMVEMLLAAGARPSAKDGFGVDAIETARRAKRGDLVTILERVAAAEQPFEPPKKP